MDETKSYDKELLDAILFVLQIYGLNPLHYNLWAKIKSGACMVILILFWCELVFGILALEDFEDIPFDITSILGFELLVFKMSILIWDRDQLAAIIKTIQTTYWKSNKYGQHARIQSNYRILKRLLFALVFIGAVLIFGLFLNPAMIKSRALPYPMYHVQQKNAPFRRYIVAYTMFLCLMAPVALPIYLVFDFFFVLLIFYNINEVKLIKKGILQLGNCDTEDELNSLINQHNLVLDCIKRMNKIFSSIMSNVLLSTIFMNCLCLVSTIMKGFPPQLVPLVLLVMFQSMLFIYCFLGTLLISETQTVAEAAYCTQWWQTNKIKMRKKLVLMIQISQKPAFLRASNVHLDLATFAQVTRITFNFFTFAQALIGDNKLK